MKIRACEVVPEDIEAVRAQDAEDIEDEVLDVKSSISTSTMRIILNEEQVVSENEEVQEGLDEEHEGEVARNSNDQLGANDEIANETSSGPLVQNDCNAESEANIQPETPNDINGAVNDDIEDREEVDFKDEDDQEAEKALQKALADEVQESNEVNEEDQVKSEISNGDGKVSSIVEDSGRESFSPTEYSGSIQHEEPEEEATIYDLDEDCEEFEKQRIVSVFIIFLRAGPFQINLSKLKLQKGC